MSSNAGLDIIGLMDAAEKGINSYLNEALNSSKITEAQYKDAQKNSIKHLAAWLNDANIDHLSPSLKNGLASAINAGKWEELVNAFRKKMSFGTGGIRGLMADDRESIVRLKEEGLDVPIIKGPNTLNDVVLLVTSAGVAKFGLNKGFNKIVIGYDSRTRGVDFARRISELFLHFGYTVYLFDEPCPYPEVTYAIPFLKADMGILLSASHNDYRYNGYKLSCGNGSQFDPKERTEMYNDYILHATTEDVQLCKLEDAPAGKLVFLGGAEKIADVDYFGCKIIDIHKEHCDHIKSFLLRDNRQQAGDSLNIGFCAFHGAGRKAVPRLLNETGFDHVNMITQNGLGELNGLFPSFNSNPGEEQQPDPGDPRAAKIAVETFQQEFPDEWQKLDILLGTDPDADRCGTVVKVPENQRFLYNNRDYMLMPADDMWALLVWFRLKFDKSIKPEESFIVLSHTTSDSMAKVATRFGLGVIKTWVGFAALSAGVRDAWDGCLTQDLVEGKQSEKDDLCHPYLYQTEKMAGKRVYNLAAMEQSNGFSILGLPPADDFSLGEKGHVRDKDGTFASILIAEVAKYAKENNTTIYELIDNEIYLDPEVGYFVNYYEPDPLDGEYPGIEGDRLKIAILKKAIDLNVRANRKELSFQGRAVKSSVIYRTGKYDHVYPPTEDFKFPDEGIRFYFDDAKMNHLTIRPSGTTNSLRFHVQLHSFANEGNLIDKKKELRASARAMVDEVRELINAPRSSEIEY
ncbi:MAG: hypothetical protein DWQ05_00785 [Calditrichaeota bacterium]|nr:MAG: hypothetical protein DWQ05_00785 [Calditrichota bacterium]